MKTLELFSLKGRTAIVTGASYGLGARFAKVMARPAATWSSPLGASTN